MSSNNGTRAKEFDVEPFFKGFGNICDINRKQGYGFMKFEDTRDADVLVYERNNRLICGRGITVEHRNFLGYCREDRSRNRFK